jgi:type II restriction enzyme
MNLSMTGELAAAYHSGAQRARVVTEFWGEQNLYCPNCNSPKLNRLRQNTKASDFRCPDCQFWFQLKGQKSAIGASIMDGAYRAMMEAMRQDEMPSFYFMHYDLATWSVRNLLLVPHFAFPPSAIVKRRPLSPAARRAGWIGCNFDLNRIPVEARIAMIKTSPSPPQRGGEGRGEVARFNSPHPALLPAGRGEGNIFQTVIVPPEQVREQFRCVKPLQDIAVTQRGWTLDVLTAVRRFGKTEFTTADAYALARELETLHPDNRHVKDKIRQQLQVLRDTGLLLHVERGVWRLP